MIMLLVSKCVWPYFTCITTAYLDDGAEDEDMAVMACRNERIKEKEVSERSSYKMVHFCSIWIFILTCRVCKFTPD